MKKKALKKDFRMEVKKTMNRFLSIFFIVALGVSFFAGIQASAPDMRDTGDWYFDEYNLMDIRVISTLGLTEDDLDAIRDVEGVAAVNGCYMEDVYCGEGENRAVIHVESLPDEMNQVAVTDGEVPSRAGECFLDISYANKIGAQVGDTLTVSVSSEEDTSLKRTEFTIAGIGYSPCYLSYNRGSTTLGTGSLSGFLYLTPEDFDTDIYTVAYIQVEGAREATSFTDEYDDLVETVSDRLEAIEDLRCEIRYSDVMEEANEKIEDARAEVEDGKKEVAEAESELADGESEAESELSEAESELLDAEQQLADGRQELEDARQQAADGEQEVEDGQREIDENSQTLSDGWQQLSDGQTQLDEGESEYQQGLEQYRTQAAAARKELKEAKKQIEEGQAQLDEGWESYNTSLAQIEDGEAQLESAREELTEQQATYDEGKQQLDEGLAQYKEGVVQLAKGKAQYKSGKAQYDSGLAQYEEGQAQYESGKTQYETGMQQLEEGRTQYEAGMQQLSDGKAQYESGMSQLASGRQAYEAGASALADQQAEYEAGAAQLAAGQAEYDAALAQIAAAQNQYDQTLQAAEQASTQASGAAADGAQKLQDAADACTAAQKSLEEAQSALEQSQKELESQQKTADACAKELESASQTQQSAAAQLETEKAAWNTAQKALDEADDDLSDEELQALKDAVDAAQERVKQAQSSLDAANDALKKSQSASDQAASDLEQKKSAAAKADENVSSCSTNLADCQASQKQLAAAQKNLEQAATQAEAVYHQTKQQTEAGKAELTKQQTSLEQTTGAELAEQTKKLKAAKTELNKASQTLSATKAELDANESALAAAKAELDANEAALSAAKEQLDANEAALSAAKVELDAKEPELKAAKAELDASKAELEAAKAQIDTSEATLKASKKKLDKTTAQMEAAAAALQEGWEQLESKSAQLESGRAQLAEAKETLESNAAELEAAQQQVDDGYAQLSDAQAQLKSSRNQLDAAQAKLQLSRQELTDGQRQLEDAQQQVADARQQLADAWQEIEDGEAELAENEQKVKDGWSDYEDGKKEAEDKIADGRQKIEDAKKELEEAEQKIADAQEELDDLRYPEWYVNDRSALPENPGYGENADRMSNLAKVIPLMFFLVAALISLTTMTRMVEEERTQIGTLKALGYSKMAIASKYMKYALFATLGGSVFGVLIGEKIFPWVIISAYGMMYPYLPKMILSYHWDYALLAMGAALICTLGATFSACIHELQAVPAQLMRPPAPKEGKRVLLERIPFLWKRLNFTWKSTVRNLVRYKKRFLMTVIGIGGCMGLLLIGYGLQDSIMSIGTLQFDELQTYDAMVILDTDASEEKQQTVQDLIASDERITDSMRFFVQQETVDTEGLANKEWSVYVYVPEEPDALQAFVSLRGRVSREAYELTDEGAIITEKIANELGLQVGDCIPLRQDNGDDIQVPILAICENYLSHYLYMTPALYEKLYGEAPDFNSVFWCTDESQETAEEIGENLLNQDAVLNITYTASLKDQIDSMLGAMDIVMIVIIVSAGMLAFVVLYNLNNININERRRELATLKVLGFFSTEVAAYVYRENILLTVIGAALGVFLGKFLHMYVITTVEVDACMFGRNINFSSFVYGVLFTFGFSIIVNFAMYFKLKKIDMVESLKSIE